MLVSPRKMARKNPQKIHRRNQTPKSTKHFREGVSLTESASGVFPDFFPEFLPESPRRLGVWSKTLSSACVNLINERSSTSVWPLNLSNPAKPCGDWKRSADWMRCNQGPQSKVAFGKTRQVKEIPHEIELMPQGWFCSLVSQCSATRDTVAATPPVARHDFMIYAWPT